MLEHVSLYCIAMSQDDRVVRVCIIGPSQRFFSGISAYTICLANALAKHNDTSAVLLRNLLPRFLYPGKGQVGRTDHELRLGTGVRVFDGMDWNSPFSWFRACRFLRQKRPEVIVMQWWTSAVVHMQLLLALVNRYKIRATLILEMHEVVDPLEERIMPIRLYSRIMGRLLMRTAAVFVVHAASVKEQVTRIYGLREDSVFVIPHALYDAYYQDCDKQAAMDRLGISEEFVILYFGLIRRYKGVPCLVEAFNKLPPDVALRSRLLIVGEDWGDEIGLSAKIAASLYTQGITYAPRFVPDEMVGVYFAAADVVALPYTRTSGSGTVSIAMAFGKPVVVSDIEALRAAVAGYEGALFTPIGDSAAIAEKIRELFARRRLGEVLVFDPPPNTWGGTARQYDSLFTQLGVGRLHE